MAESFIRLPADSTGKVLDTRTVSTGNAATTEIIHREIMLVGGDSSSLAVVTSSHGLQVQSTQPLVISSGTVTLSSVHTVTATGPVTITSGLVSVTSGTITSTAATNPWSSAPSFNVPMVSASSGLVQITGTPLINIVGTSSGVAVVTTSDGLRVSSTQPQTISGTVTVLSASSGLVQISGTAAVSISTASLVQTNVVTSSGAYVPVTTGTGLLVRSTSATSLSSGTVTLSSNHTIISASSGLIQLLGTVTTSTPEYAAGIQLVSMTTAGALRVFSTSASGSGSTEVNIVGTSGGQAVVTTSGGLAVTIVAGAGAGSTAVHIVSSTGGFVTATTALLGIGWVTTSGGTLVATTSDGGMVQVTTGKIVPVLAASSGVVSIDQVYGSTTAGLLVNVNATNLDAGRTFIAGTTISKLSSAPGTLWMVSVYATSTGGALAAVPGILRLYNATTGSVTAGASMVWVQPIAIVSSSTATAGATAGPFSYDPVVMFGPRGLWFGTACSADVGTLTTGAANPASWRLAYIFTSS